MRIILFLGVWALLSQTVWAKTSDWTDDIIGDVPLKSEPSNSFIDTVVGTCEIPKYPQGWVSVKVPGMEDFSFRNEKFKYNRFRTDAFFQKNKDGSLKLAPLMVIFPGIFAASFDNSSAYLGERYWRKGYHVLIVPNPWSLQYTNQSKNKMGDVLKEAEEGLSLVYQFQDHLNKQGALLRTQQLGMSYGAFLGAVVNALDAEGENRLNGQVVLLGPPVYIEEAFKRLDKMVDETQELFRITSIFSQKWYHDYFCKKYPMDYNPGSKEGARLRDVARMFVAHRGFQIKLAGQISGYDLRYNVGHRPNEERDGKDWYAKLDTWKDSLRFSTWFELYAPELLKDYPEEMRSFLHWKARLKARDPDRLLVLSSVNDFLNADGDWDRAGDELLLLPTGGHLGYRTDPKVLRMLDRAYERDLREER